MDVHRGLTNAWGRLTRKDNGAPIAGKWIEKYINGTLQSGGGVTGPYGWTDYPLDFNITLKGENRLQLRFVGDEEFEASTSPEHLVIYPETPKSVMTVKDFTMAPSSGVAPLTVLVEGRFGIPDDWPVKLAVFTRDAEDRITDVNFVAETKTHGYELPPEYPRTGAYEITYTFEKPGIYAVCPVFPGDDDYLGRRGHSKAYQRLIVNEAPGGLPLSFEETVTVTVTGSKTIKRILSATEPAAPDGYARAPEYDLDCGVLGKYWAFVKTA